MKKQKGITLIALVVTIIVLIILAVISINVVFGEEGILERARAAQDKQKIGEYLDKFALAEANTAAENEGIVTLELFIEEVEKQGIVPSIEIEGEKYILTSTEGYIFEAILKAENDVEINYKETGEAIPEEILVTLNKTKVTIREGNTETLTATITPVNASNKSVTWTSSNEEIAEVDENGTITGKSAGDVTISVKEESGKEATCEVTVVEELDIALSDGMTPVKWNGSSWTKTEEEDPEWYNYDKQEWANVQLNDGSMLVWIPRYAYKIESGWHQASTELTSTGGAGEISVVFIDTDNKDKNGTEYNTSYATATANSATTHKMSAYVQHPAFTYGTKELKGFWVGKFESSHTGCGTTASTGQVAYSSSLVLQIKPGITSWRNIQVSDIYTVCTNMNSSSTNPYGLNTSDSVVDPHMLKNTEWGAIAYLSKSVYGKYGKDGEEVWNNSNSSFLTGQAGSGIDAKYESSTNAYSTTNGVKASTTGTVYGVYDMSGGNWEYVAAYVNNSYIKDTTSVYYGYGENLITSTKAEHKDVYTQGSSDTRPLNYEANSGKYGDAVYEVSSNGESNPYGWYEDYSTFVFTNYPFFYRGGYNNHASYAGVFSFYSSTLCGAAHTNIGFRLTVPVL